MVRIGNDWDEILKDEWQKPYYLKLRKDLAEEYKNHIVYPHPDNIFNALKLTPYKDVKCVIIGQDPYHNPGQAHGLCFSVKPGTEPPPSLKNIFKEYSEDLGLNLPDSGDLTPWAKSGVLMLNTYLTVRKNAPLSHKNIGWANVTDRIILEINKKQTPVVFILWGRPAQEKAQIIDNPLHLKLKAPHPSPLSCHYGFFGCRHFSRCNEYLTSHGIEPVNWDLSRKDT